MSSGPLDGIRILEIAGLGPGPYAGLLLSDLGADVVSVDRPSRERAGAAEPRDIVRRGRRSIELDLGDARAVAIALDLVERADAVIEPFRPGVAERLGIGPDVCLQRNPRLVYGRMTGWGQSGPLAHHAGHDINYVALAGALAHIGRPGQPPVPPLNLAGDMGGGGLLLAFGILAGLLEAGRSGRGQVIDAAIVDGVASLMTIIRGFDSMGFMAREPGTNAFDSGAPFYEVYRCADGEYVSVGAIERKFYDPLVRALGLDEDELPPRGPRENWPEIKGRMAAVFATRTREEWSALLEPNPDICFAPVLSMVEAPLHPHLAERGTFLEVDGVVQPAPVPRFSRTPGRVQGPAPGPGADTDGVLVSWLGLSSEDLEGLRCRGVIR